MYAMRILVFASFLLVSSYAEKVDLNGYWFVSSAKPKRINRLVGNVPGGIYTDLKNGQILNEDFLYRFNDVNYRWVGNQTWLYKKQFTVSKSVIEKASINLVCEGLDTAAKISINGETVGKSDNMFVKYEYDIKKVLKAGNNEIEVLFESPIQYAKNQYLSFLWSAYSVPPMRRPPSEHGECHVNFIRKMQCSFGWDWGPAFPSVGIWKPIYIESYDAAVITDITLQTMLNTEEEKDRWSIKMNVFLNKGSIKAMDGTFTIKLDDNLLVQKRVLLAIGHNVQHIISFDILQTMDIKRWWPNGFGDQNLYNLSVQFTDTSNKETTQISKNIGFRIIELIQDQLPLNGLSFYFKINGLRIFSKGSNWIPADILPERATDETVYDLLLSTKNANMNMLRVWGGGIYESDFFYETADKMGILIWQDMMFACGMYQTGSEFLKSVSLEITQQIRRLQHHPSIAIWAGNNENEAALAQNWYQTRKRMKLYKKDYVELYIHVIRKIVMHEDPMREYLSSSPTNGLKSQEAGWVALNPADWKYGDIHFYNYFKDLWSYTIYPKARFVSEYGYQSWPSFSTIERVSAPEDWNWGGKFVWHRQHVSVGQASLNRQISFHFDELDQTNKTRHFVNTCYLTQINQAMAIKTQTESYRRLMGNLDDFGLGDTMGALYWQLNDVWQAPSWSSIEYGGKWKMLHYYAKNFFNGILASPYADTINVYCDVIIDEPGMPTNLTLTVHLYSWNSFKPAFTQKISFDVESFNATKVYNEEKLYLLEKAKLKHEHDYFMIFNLTDREEKQILSTNFLFSSAVNPDGFKYLQSIDLKKANIEVKNVSRDCDKDETLKTFNIILTSDSIALFVWLDLPNVKGWFSQNGFQMITPKVSVKFYTYDVDVDSSLVLSSLLVTSLMDVY